MISGDVGATKPDERIYRALLDGFQLQPGAAVFIDDRADNVEAAERFGMRGIQFEDPDSLRRSLIDLGLPLESA